MAARTAKKAEPVQEDVPTNGNGKGTARISFSCDAATRRNIRIAAAHADLDVGEWIAKVLNTFANKAIDDAAEGGE